MHAFHTPESRLLDHETLLEIVRTSPCAVVEIDAGGAVQAWNDHAGELFGFTGDEVLGKELPIQASDRARAKASREGSSNPLTHPNKKEFETELLGRNGYPIAVSIWHSQLRDSDGSDAGHVSIISDCRERKALETAVIESVEEESNRLGRSLHDSLSQQLLGAAFAAKALANQVSRNESIDAKQLDDLAGLINEAVRETRSLSQSLNPIEAQVGGLKSGLELLAEQISSRVPCQFVSRRPVLISDLVTAAHVFRIAHEAVHAIASHESASWIEINLDESGDDVTLRIDYRGAENFAEGEFPAKHAIHYRVNAIHGTMEFAAKDARTDSLIVTFSKF